MPTHDIIDNRHEKLVDHINRILAEYERHGYPLPPESAARVAELEREIDERVAGAYGVELVK